MKSLNSIFFRLNFYLISGIILAFNFSLDLQILALLLFIGLATFVFSFFRSRKLVFDDHWFAFNMAIVVVLLGAFATSMSMPEHLPDHIIHKKRQKQVLQAKVLEEWKPTENYFRYLLEIEAAYENHQTEHIQGKVLLHLPKGTDTLPQPGNYILLPDNLTKAVINDIPGGFDYSRFLKNQKIERVSYLKSSAELFYLPKTDFSFQSLRKKVIKNLENKGLKSQESAILKALLLGERSEISTQLYKNYAAAGAVHILAISGLHIGILLLFLNFLLKPLEKLKRGKILKTILILIILWFFALLTGFSPSVVRAAAMFSFIAIGMQLNRKTRVVQSVLVSLFFLLLLNPYYILQVGFQLSYLAVFGIILFEPKIENLVHTPHKTLEYFWKLVSVSIAAQLAILPLSLYYFHQFPGLFLLTNILIIPILAIVLIYGFLVVILASFQLLPGFLLVGLGELLKVMNWIILKIASMENFIWKDIPFSELQLLSAYGILVLLILLLYSKSSRFVIGFLFSILVFQVICLCQLFRNTPDQLLVLNNYNDQIILKKQHQLLTRQFSLYDQNIQNYHRENRIQEMQDLPNTFSFCEENFLILDSAALYTPSEVHFKAIILTNSPQINLDRLISEMQPDELIISAGNYPAFQDRWKRTALKAKIPFYAIAEKGAYILNCD
ncbi:MAG: ComEC/Rec2 family competence protein [Christiangramia sp.]|uniref:ComEC/Rec2 family competence protein n=1 Tax=Christiangramia sp. TaxID=1931228 RepID=UPI0032426FC0